MKRTFDMQSDKQSNSLRDQIAMSALPAFPHLMIVNQPEEVAKAVYRLADAVLAEKRSTAS